MNNRLLWVGFFLGAWGMGACSSAGSTDKDYGGGGSLGGEDGGLNKGFAQMMDALEVDKARTLKLWKMYEECCRDFEMPVYNTIGNVETQDRQIACFENAAAHLEPGGCFVIEMMVPDLRRLVPGHDAVVGAHAPGYVCYDRYDDLVAQHAVSHHFFAEESGVREVQTPWRYVWPSELDLMARLVGLELTSRWADWSRSPFTGDSPSHVSVWHRKP